MLSFQNLADMSPRRKLFWAALAVVAFFQLIALYIVCSQQMQKAQVREAAWNAQRGALIDCLDYLPKSTVGGCRSQMASGGESRNARPQAGAMTAAMPVSFNYR